MPKAAAWRTYEEVAVFLIDSMASRFGLDRMEGKQKVEGAVTTTTWEIDGKGFDVDGDGFVILEARRYTSSKLSQEDLGALAFRIADTGATGGIVVTPIGLQLGAEKVAQAANIRTVTLASDSTPENYMLRFLNHIFPGVTDTIYFAETVAWELRDADGNLIGQGRTEGRSTTDIPHQ